MQAQQGVRGCCDVSSETLCVCSDSCQQHFVFLTHDKPAGRRWVSKEQYIRYFLLCYDILYEEVNLTLAERRAALEVRQLCPSILCLLMRYLGVPGRAHRFT